MAATGGTRVNAALRWAGDQFAIVNEAEFRLLFLLSDFCFWEDKKDLYTHARRLADLGLVLLAASHGYVQESTLNALVHTIGGRNLELKSVEKLPLLLIETLKQLADGAFRMIRSGGGRWATDRHPPPIDRWGSPRHRMALGRPSGVSGKSQ